jgi:mono/diheme cytochrome c family protein
MTHTLTFLAALAALATLQACANAQTETPLAAGTASPEVLAGGRLAERTCGECHATSGPGPSPLSDAPPFTVLAARLDLSQFTRAYRDGLFEGHPLMPRVILGPDELAELTAYLESL